MPFPAAPLDVFVSYAPADEALRAALDDHLAVLHRQGHIASFHAGAVGPGEDWKAAVDAHLGRARLVLVLVSADLLASRRHYEEELEPALARHDRGEARVIPVVLRACDWRSTPLGKLPPLPADGAPIAGSSTVDRDAAFFAVAQGVREAVEALRAADRPARAPGAMAERAAQVRLILQWLLDPSCTGVAILEPFGFGADALADEVLRELARPGERLLPVRMVPEPRSTTEDRLYAKLWRDLRRALPDDPGFKKHVEDRKEASAKDRFEFAVEDLLDGPVRAGDRQLLFVVEGLGHVPEAQLVEWGMLLQRLSDRGLKLLVWGGRELYDLRTRPPSGGIYSAFSVLREVTLGALSMEAVERMLPAAAKGVAGVVHELTGGHPALVSELIQRFPEEVASGDREAMRLRVLAGEHMTRLRRAVEGDAGIRDLMRGFAGAARPMVRGKVRGDERLFWLGVLKDAGPGRWDWAAPVMMAFAGEWA